MSNGTINQTFNITYKTNKGNIYTYTTTQELDVEIYLDRVEECHGYHEMWELEPGSAEEAIELFKEDTENLKELCEEYDEQYNWDDGERVESIVEVKEI